MQKPTLVCLFMGILFSLSCLALPQDKNEIIHFSAGVIEWDQLEHLGRFSHKVSFKQGTTQLFASNGFTQGDTNNQFQKITLYGSKNQQAHFLTLPKPKEQMVHAYADKMVYLPQKKLIQLYDHVYVTQGRFHFRAPYLQYDLEKKKLISKSSNQELTNILIDPEKS